jgi:hypothetical protein
MILSRMRFKSCRCRMTFLIGLGCVPPRAIKSRCSHIAFLSALVVFGRPNDFRGVRGRLIETVVYTCEPAKGLFLYVDA